MDKNYLFAVQWLLHPINDGVMLLRLFLAVVADVAVTEEVLLVVLDITFLQYSTVIEQLAQRRRVVGSVQS